MNKARKLYMDPEDIQKAQKLIASGNTPVNIVLRCKILLAKESGKSDEAIAGELGINRRTVTLWVDKYKNRSLEPKDDLLKVLKIAPGRGRKEEVTGEAKTWLISLACSKPKDYGRPEELWTYKGLQKYVNEHAVDAGYPRLKTITHTGIKNILDKSHIKPFRYKYYCERRDPEHEDKMHNLLVQYKQLSLQFDDDGKLLPWNEEEGVVHVLSYDEKPGIQAIGLKAKDLPPDENHSTHRRDYEYVRYGTVSLLTAIDLQTGEAIPLVRRTHTSEDYIDFLTILDEKYPKEHIIRLTLDNLRVHSSQKVQAWVKQHPGRFQFVFTPKHASWLNLVESFFSKLTRQMLRGIRVDSVQELMDRILLYFDMINKEPIVYHWTWELDDVDENEEVLYVTFD